MTGAVRAAVATLLSLAALAPAIASAQADGGTRDARLVPPGGRAARGTVANLAIVGVVEGAAFAFTWALTEEVSLWDKSLPPAFYLRRAYSHPPVWDRDSFLWNWVIHPVAGQQAYRGPRSAPRRLVDEGSRHAFQGQRRHAVGYVLAECRLLPGRAGEGGAGGEGERHGEIGHPYPARE